MASRSFAGHYMNLTVGLVIACLVPVSGCDQRVPLDHMPKPSQLPLPKACFDFFDDIDRDLIRQRIEESQAEFVAHAKPDGMDADVFKKCLLLTTVESQVHDAGTLEVKDTGEVVDACFTSEAGYLVTLGDSLSVWKIADRTRVRNFDVPVSAPLQVMIANDAREATVVGQREIANISLKDGAVLKRCSIPEGIAYARRATETGHVAVCTTSRHLLLLSPDLQTRTDCPDTTLTTPLIAVQPAGKWVLGNHDAGMLRWHVEPSRIELLGNKYYDPHKARPLSGVRYDRWVDNTTIHEFQGLEHTDILPIEPESPLILTPLGRFAFTCSNSIIEDWLLVLAQNRAPERREGVYAFDVYPLHVAASMPVEVTAHKPNEVYVAPAGDWLAIQDANGLHLVRRSTWLEHTGGMVISCFTELLREERFEQLDILFEYLRSHTLYPCGKSGEQLAGDLIHNIANCWVAWSKNSDNAERLASMDRWLDKGSTLAVASSAQRHVFIGSEARGGGLAESVSEDGWHVFMEQGNLARADLARLANLEKPPVRVLNLSASLALNGDGTREEAASIFRKATELYPLDLDVHLVGCFWSLPRWGGEERQLGAYLQALCELYPPELADVMYAKLAALLSVNVKELEGEQFGIDYLRALNGLEPWLKEFPATLEETEAALQMVQMVMHRGEILERIADYHFAHFDLPRANGYYGNAINLILQARTRALEGG